MSALAQIAFGSIVPGWEALARASALSDPFTRACLAGLGVVVAGVTALAAHAVLTGPRAVQSRWWLIGGGMLLPCAILATLLGHAFATRAAQYPPLPAHGVVQIEVTGRQWWWDVRYVGPDGRPVALANELRVPVGRPVVLRLGASDVIHRFWVPGLAGPAQMVPGRVTHVRMQSARAGVFRGQCAQYCGVQHALMALHVVAEEEAAFGAWLARQAAPATPPDEPLLREGRDLFLRAGCGGCHTVRGTEARGEIGPDLTHVGSRRTLAAGTLRNHPGALAAWIAHSQRIKPGSLMPSASQLHPRELGAVAAYLESLE